MITEDKFGLKPIWDAVLEIYEEFAKVCEKHGLRYYVTDGNALGAVRHKGFIPWDDDLDVCMPRPDYEKFLKLGDAELPSHLRIVHYANTPEYYWLFAKVQETRREKVEAVEEQVGHMLSNGVFIDVFPIDGYPMGKFEQLMVKLKNIILLPLYRYRTRPYKIQSRKGKIPWIAGMLLSPFIPFWRSPQKMMAKMDSELMRFPFETSEMTGRACSRTHVLYRPPTPRSAWGKGKKVEYYDREVVIPENADAHLRSEFGPNYMTPPPVEKQHPTHTYSHRCPWWLGPTNSQGKRTE